MRMLRNLLLALGLMLGAVGATNIQPAAAAACPFKFGLPRMCVDYGTGTVKIFNGSTLIVSVPMSSGCMCVTVSGSRFSVDSSNALFGPNNNTIRVTNTFNGNLWCGAGGWPNHDAIATLSSANYNLIYWHLNAQNVQTATVVV